MNETGSHGNDRAVSVPATGRAFEAWLGEQDKSDWSPDLVRLAEFARLSFQVADRADNRFDVTQSAFKKDLSAFVEAYTAHMTRQ